MDPMEGTAAYRLKVARNALDRYHHWLDHEDHDLASLPPIVRADLATCAAWLAEMLQVPGRQLPGGHAPAAIAMANTAVAHLDTREMRDVLNVLAMQVPALVITAITEAGA